MCCLHRFIDYHAGGLFPSWNVKYLIIGTFNPSWNKPGNNADYFYGRSNYMWLLLPRFVFEDSLQESSVEEKISFCRRHFIGFTDLIKRIDNTDYNNPHHKEKILSFRDRDLLELELPEHGAHLQFNTAEIIDYIDNNPHLERVYFSFLGQNLRSISAAMAEIEANCNHKNPVIPTHRLHTHTGQGLGEGAPRANVLTRRWLNQGLNFGVDLNPNDFPFN
jgi:hypothetical protein